MRSSRQKVIKRNDSKNKPDMYDYPYYSDDATVDDVTDDYIVDDGAGGWYSNGYGGDVYYYGFTDFEGNKEDEIKHKENEDRHTLNWASRNNPMGVKITPPVLQEKKHGNSYVIAAISGVISNVNKNAGKRIIDFSTSF